MKTSLQNSRPSARRTLPAAVGAILAIAFSLIPAVGGHAQSTELKECLSRDKKGEIDFSKAPKSPCRLTIEPADSIGQHAWFWMSNEKVSTCLKDPVQGVCTGPSLGGQPPANPPGTTSPISNGHIGVSLKDGSPDMRAYMQAELGLFPPGATFSTLDLVMPVSHPTPEHTGYHGDSKRVEAQSKAPATVNQNDAAMRACLVTGAFPTGANGDPPVSTTIVRPQLEQEPGVGDDRQEDVEVITEETEPPFDCAITSEGVRSKDGSRWTFNLLPMAAKWGTGEVLNNGVALDPVENAVNATWTVEMHGGMTSVERSDPVDEDAGSETVVLVPRSQAAFVVAEWFGGIEPPPPPPPIPSDSGPTFPSFNTPPSDAPPPVPIPNDPGPVVTDPGPSVQPVAANPQTSAWVWALLPLGMLALGLVTSAVGEDPTWAVGEGNRVAGVLRARRMGGLIPAEATGPPAEG